MKKKTPEELHEKMIHGEIGKLSTRVKNQCKKAGLSSMEYQLVWLKEHPKSLLPVEELNNSQTIEAWELGIVKYRESLEISQPF